MVVALLYAGPERRRLDLGLERHLRGLCRVELERSGHALEQAAHPAHHHVPAAKFDLGVPRLKKPLCHRYRYAAVTVASDCSPREAVRIRNRTVVSAVVSMTRSTAFNIRDGPSTELVLT